uniref:Transmembrane protein n=1 Tax=Panagrolaimus sp. PS1159 TaxID=55785 RepID=A0AC35EX69_9BILA
MLKALFLFLLFALFKSNLSASPCANFFQAHLSPFLPKCDVEKDFQQIYNENRCSNLVEVQNGNSSKTFLEIRSPVIFNSRLEMIVDNLFGTYFTSWNFYTPKNGSLPFLFLTSNINSIIVQTNNYVLVVDSNGKNITEKVFSKTEKKLIDFIVLKSFEKKIIRVRPGSNDGSIIIATLENGSKDAINLQIPKRVESVNVGNGASPRSSFYGGERYFIIVPIGLIFYAIKSCFYEFCKKKPENEDDENRV